MNDSSYGTRRALARIGDATLIGVLVVLFSIPVVTMFAALSAGLRGLDDQHTGMSGTTGRFCRDFRAVLRPSVTLTLIWCIGAVVGGLDLAFGLACGSTPLGYVMTVTGGMVLVGLSVVVPSVLWRLGVTGPDEGRATTVLTDSIVLAGLSPGRTMLSGPLTVVTCMLCLLAPVASPGVLALYLYAVRGLMQGTRGLTEGDFTAKRQGQLLPRGGW